MAGRARARLESCRPSLGAGAAAYYGGTTARGKRTRRKDIIRTERSREPERTALATARAASWPEKGTWHLRT